LQRVPDMQRLLALLASLVVSACAPPAGDGGPTSGHDPKADGFGDPVGLPVDLAPWGGGDAGRWTTEALIANAVTAELVRTGDPRARVSLPTSLWMSSYAPFGDGQTNAAASFAYWEPRRPALIASRSGTRLSIRVDRALPLGDGHDGVFELWTAGGQWAMSAASTRTPEGDWLIQLDPVPGALADRLLVSPRGWRDVFPLRFDAPVSALAAFAATVPGWLDTLPGGEPVVDPVHAGRRHQQERPVVDALRASHFPAGFINQAPFVADGLHASFPQTGPPLTTAVGQAYTWVAEQPFADLYVCLERRRADLEALHGVPSGAGWHHIGAPGETILASLEEAPLLVGHAAGQPMTLPPGAGWAYDLDLASSYTLLQPGQVFTTPRGDFHWYAVHETATDPCVQIWVHRCVPDPAAPSFACPGE
jgi:hypothetical protein